ncbi:hypothetical protein THAOC_34122 [Thalassiosira oceanica]|uniref:MATH domain-containing protein n=1 Tax=Thalassiosira oceanica TaxID=159749 RepID=K0R421_THAOC|nr:hypothetical protein THAOC_34122 [Thalassiosira oceanica]|eukprot:EJK47180.1 hypothetical protein THAOC_34122 [Thalassiosira oceanica]
MVGSGCALYLHENWALVRGPGPEVNFIPEGYGLYNSVATVKTLAPLRAKVPRYSDSYSSTLTLHHGSAEVRPRVAEWSGAVFRLESFRKHFLMITLLEPVEVGAPPGRLSDWVIAPVRFNEFAGLRTTKGVAVYSPEFSCFGHRWTLGVFPGGDDDSNNGFVALRLVNETEECIGVEFKFIIKHPRGGENVWGGTCTGEMSMFAPASSDGDAVNDVWPARGCPNFARRSKLMNYLVDGTLIVEVHMRTNKPVHQSASFVPENPTLQNMLNDFGNEETADVKFEVGGTVESAKGRRKRAKTSTTTFHAHHYALRLNAPALADMCKPGDDSPTAISNVQPEIFMHLLYYCYGGKIDKDDLQSDAKDMIEAADRFGIVSLKLEAEACYVDTVELTLDNIVELVTYADSKNLALLKEHCLDYLSSANKIEVAKKVSFDDIPSHLMKDWMVSLARREGGGRARATRSAQCEYRSSAIWHMRRDLVLTAHAKCLLTQSRTVKRVARRNHDD